MNFTTLMVVILGISILVFGAEQNTSTAPTDENRTTASPGSPTNKTSEVSSTTTTTTTTTSPSTDTPDCGSLKNISNGKLTRHNVTTVGGVATLVCNEGYNITGDGTISCMANGSWSPSPTCKIKDCGSLKNISNGKLTRPNVTTVGGVATLVCNEGYNITGDGTISCMANGSWSPSPTCKIKDCGVFPHKDNINVSYPEGSSYQANATVTCVPGYEINNTGGEKTQYVTCLNDGNWSIPKGCVKKDCGVIPHKDNINVSYPEGSSYQANATVTCVPGYKINNTGGEETQYVTCLNDGNWSIPKGCVKKDCGVIPHKDNINVSYPEGSSYQANATVTCVPGYKINNTGGEETQYVTCLNDGNWSIPKGCVKKDCDDIPHKDNINVSYPEGSSYQANATVTCVPGYEINNTGGEETQYVTCLNDGNWSIPKGCVKKEIQFNESCTPVDGLNLCITDNAVCRKEEDRGYTCVCKETAPYFYNNACIAGLNITVTGINCFVSGNQVLGPASNSIMIACTSPSISEDTFDGYNVRIVNSTRQWSFVRKENTNNILDNLKAGEIYHIEIFPSKDSIPSIERKTIEGVTRPTSEANWSLRSIDTSWFLFENNDTSADPLKTYSVELNTTDINFSTNCSSKTEREETTICSILQNESYLNISKLISGSSYEIQIFSQIKFNGIDIKSNTPQFFVNYTVPELPDVINIPLGNITHDSFIVSFESNGNNRFTYWSVVVINSETGKWVAEDTRPSDVKALQISTNITSSTFYVVQVQTHVPMQSSDLFNTTFNTRPRRPNSGVLVKANVTEREITLYIKESEEERFDYYSLIITSTDKALFSLTGPSNVSCEQIGNNCTFPRTANFSTEVTVKKLNSGKFYSIHLYSIFNGLPSLESQDLSSYTVPALPHFIVENISSNGFFVGFNETQTNFLWWNIIGIEETSNKVPRSSLSYKFENLLSGHQYDLEIYTEVDGFISLKNYTETVFTLPSTPSLLEFPIEYVKENSFKANITVPNTRFDNLSIKVCEDLEPSTCYTREVNNTYFNGHDSVTKLLSFENLSSATNYSVTAKTGLANGVNSVTSFVYYMNTAPVPPRVHLEYVEETLIELNVTGNTELKIDKYCIQLNTSNCYKIDVDTPGTIIISNLQAGQNYSLKVYTVWNDIESERFKEIETYTKPNPVKADEIDVDVVTNSTLSVVWNKPPAYTHGYELQWNCESPNIGTNMENDQAQNVKLLSATVSNLDPGTFCNVTITAYIINYDNATLQAMGVFKVILNSTLEEAPGIPESIENTDLTSRTSTIELQEPNKRNGILRRYDIWVLNNETETCEQLMTYKCTDCDGSSPNASNSVPNTCIKSHSEMFSKRDATLSWKIQQLHPFRDYSAHVVVYTTKPGGVSAITFETHEDVPGKPVGLNASTTHDSYSLQWSPPEERNGIVLNYTVKAAYYEHACGGFGPLQVERYGVELDPKTKFTQNGLHAYWQYNLTVEATNAIATGKPSEFISVRTKETNPGSVQQLNYQDVSSKSVGVSWTKPCFANGILTGYSVNITKLLSQGQEENSYTKSYKIDVANDSTSIYDLLPYRSYKVEVYALNSAGDGELSNVSFRTKIDYPDKPIKVSTKNKTSSSLLIEWEKAVHFNGPTKYIVHINDSVNGSIRIQSCKTSVSNWTDTLATDCNVPGLDAYWEYDIVVDAITFEEGFGELIESSERKTFRTADAVPGPVAQFDVTPEQNVLEERNFHIDWKKPIARDLNGVLTGFVIHYQSEKIEVRVGPNTTSKTLYRNVIGSYNVSIQARTSVGPGAAVHKEITVNPGAPIKVDESKNPLMLKASVSVDDDEKQIAVTLPLAEFLCNRTNGPPTMWGIVVAEADEAATDTAFAGKRNDFQKKIDDIYKTWFQVDGLNNIPPYIVTKPNWKPPCSNKNRRKRSATDDSNIYVIGNDVCHGSSTTKEYCNGPLPDGRSFKVKSFVCTDYGCSESVYSQPIETEPNMTAAFVGGAVSAVVVLVLVVLVIFFMRRRQAACFKKDTESISHTSSDQFGEMGTMQTREKPVAVYKPGPVKLTEFPDFVEKMHKDSDLLFADAYKAIKEKSPKHPCTVAESQNCRAKNRYTNILSFDHSRVKLRPSDDVDGSDFINANYIPGYTSPREYIATQGPMLATFDDFWRMVWEQNVDTIVMLTKLVEKGRIKCDKYWPDVNEPVYYGDLVVSVTSESNLSDYTLRIFEIKMKGERRSVRQFAYLKWPDMGCPEDPEMLLEFVKSVKEHNKRPGGAQNAGPMIVHCSAGVGRTGTFIVVDHVLQHIRDHDEVDVYKLVLDMRNHRCNMVQTEDQFIYIHECLKAFITTDEDEEEEEPEDEHLYENTRMGEDNIYENTAYQNDSL
ncbi:receptor-type tyrosine-protein phosphatase eta-like isoform X2 [Mya arenaria]|uniref:receptor-type tyrosine-protein phosphatase eta-like isoform X2 n=1 Tax=Mya arenaria TaxID=6604 RepID=UPI0022E5EAB8|nr:receptor-type tyrosine-protein phosphatase eta-like isoform X2 [Mya arenaria]